MRTERVGLKLKFTFKLGYGTGESWVADALNPNFNCSFNFNVNSPARPVRTERVG